VNAIGTALHFKAYRYVPAWTIGTMRPEVRE